jgi:hypothetical protein
MKTKNMTTLHLGNLISRSPLRRGFLLVTLALCCVALSPMVQAVSPPPDGGYPNGNTAEGTNALLSLTSGSDNTANGGYALYFNTSGTGNTANGRYALYSNATGFYNTADGDYALYSNTTGIYNTANGVGALQNNTTGNNNTANGVDALLKNTTGNGNTANGLEALFGNATGGYNTANGLQVLYNNTTGYYNTGTGIQALFSNTTGNYNTANGVNALFSNTTGGGNTAVGYQALFSNVNTSDAGNTAVGYQALFFNTTSDDSSNALGYQALYSQTTGQFNNGFGWQALYNNVTGQDNTAIGDGAGAFITGSFNTCLGADAGQAGAGTNNVYIGFGQSGTAGENNTTRISNIYTTVQPVAGTDPDVVTISSSGRLGRGNISSRRYKHDIKPMDKASEAIFALQPVIFRYKQEFDATQTLAYGLIAEEVAEVYPDLVGRNPKGQPESVRYEQINAMLLNEFLKEHRKVEEQEAAITQLRSTVAQQQKGMEVLAASLKEQASQIHKVSAQLELSKSAPQMAGNDR